MAHLLFSYGTLQLERVQLDSFGRKLHGTSDRLPGFRLGEVEIKDEHVLASSGKAFHPIACPSDDPADAIEGTAFELTDAELEQADAYEVADYQRIEVQLASGRKAWVYVSSS